MNINTVWTNTIDSMPKQWSDIKKFVKSKRYKLSNPFPKDINVTVKFDLVGTYSDLLKKFDSMSEADMKRIANIFEKKHKIIAEMIEKQLK